MQFFKAVDMPELERRQFKCSDCDGRTWRDNYDPPRSSVCHKCNNPGELVPEDEEILVLVPQFQCMNDECDSCTHAWYKRAERSKCKFCDEYGRQVPVGEEVEWRQFYCAHCNERWIDMATRSKCVECGGDAEMVPKGEEIGVFVCKFECSAEGCTNEYRVTCKMSNKAVCYDCSPKHLNSPYAFEPRRRIKRKTEKQHSCSQCNGSGNCPNLRPNAVTYGPRRRRR